MSAQTSCQNRIPTTKIHQQGKALNMSRLKLYCDVDAFCPRANSREDAKLFGLTGKRGPAPPAISIFLMICASIA